MRARKASIKMKARKKMRAREARGKIKSRKPRKARKKWGHVRHIKNESTSDAKAQRNVST